jgi:hypothetical protein
MPCSIARPPRTPRARQGDLTCAHNNINGAKRSALNPSKSDISAEEPEVRSDGATARLVRGRI